jgi:acetylornithine/N-succinyldiaminopimelate aminotransferase
MGTLETIQIEDQAMPPFFRKTQISIARGEGVYVWDEEGRRYLDLTAGWGVTSLGHAHPVIVEALAEQARKIVQNPNSGLTYSPARARLLELMRQVLPANLTRIFFTNSGAEANDAAIKLARKITGRLEVISTLQSFHGRTISTASATGQAKHRDKYKPLMPNYRFVPFNDAAALAQSLDENVAAVIIEPIQGEGGVRLPKPGYLEQVAKLCKANGSLLIMDEVQTGFCRCGPMFITKALNFEADFLTMAKGIAGGFPFGAFAMTEAAAARIERGDHGGTYCGNPLGCAVAYAVINYLVTNNITDHVEQIGGSTLERLRAWQQTFPNIIREVRGQGLLIAIEFDSEDTATFVTQTCLERGVFVLQTQGIAIRILPALNIKQAEIVEGLAILEAVIAEAAKRVV